MFINIFSSLIWLGEIFSSFFDTNILIRLHIVTVQVLLSAVLIEIAYMYIVYDFATQRHIVSH